MKKIYLIILVTSFPVFAHYDYYERNKECKDELDKIISIVKSLEDNSPEKLRLNHNLKEAQPYLDNKKYCKALDKLLK
tara:strand:- start:107 stop:340 length:234 start_codon:yes stop_codon:yes gene_type:complete